LKGLTNDERYISPLIAVSFSSGFSSTNALGGVDIGEVEEYPDKSSFPFVLLRLKTFNGNFEVNEFFLATDEVEASDMRESAEKYPLPVSANV